MVFPHLEFGWAIRNGAPQFAQDRVGFVQTGVPDDKYKGSSFSGNFELEGEEKALIHRSHFLATKFSLDVLAIRKAPNSLLYGTFPSQVLKTCGEAIRCPKS